MALNLKRPNNGVFYPHLNILMYKWGIVLSAQTFCHTSRFLKAAPLYPHCYELACSTHEYVRIFAHGDGDWRHGIGIFSWKFYLTAFFQAEFCSDDFVVISA